MGEDGYSPVDRKPIDTSHVLVPTAINPGYFECALCWGCTCHRIKALTETCGKYPKRSQDIQGL